MKQLTCEMCGSTDLIKDGGVFVCQNCGCKYSVEEAKKMMIEGTVEVTGTVKIDKREDLAMALKRAEAYLAEFNWIRAYEYSEKALDIDLDCADAYLFRYMAQARINNKKFVYALLGGSYEAYRAWEGKQLTYTNALECWKPEGDLKRFFDLSDDEDYKNTIKTRVASAGITIVDDKIVSVYGEPDGMGRNTLASRIIIIPDFVTEFSKEALRFLRSCYRDFRFAVSTDNKHFCSHDGSLYSISDDGVCLEVASEAFATNPFRLHKNTTAIAEYAFRGLTSMRSVVLNETIKTIGEGAFYNCGLTEIVIPDGVETIDEYVFNGCHNLKSVKFGNAVRKIGRCAFSGCTWLSEVKFNEGLKTIGESAFEGCKMLKEVVIPLGVKELHKTAFSECYPGLILKKGLDFEAKKCQELFETFKTAFQDEMSQKAYAIKRITELNQHKRNLLESQNKWDEIEKNISLYNNELKCLQESISTLCVEKASLGFFAVKRKKEIEDEIAGNEEKIQSLNQKINNENARKHGCSSLQSLNHELSQIEDQINAQNKIASDISAEGICCKLRNELAEYNYGKKLLSEYGFLIPDIGDCIKFGSYYQTNDGEKSEIEWRVLARQGNSVLVISKNALDSKPYNNKRDYVTWENCTLRKWLNNEFINSAFSDYEKSIIPTVTVSADKNPGYVTDPGAATEDKIFLLSISEVEQYIKDISNKNVLTNRKRRCKPTDYVVKNGAIVDDTYKTCMWWLRSPGSNQLGAAYVCCDGKICEEGGIVEVNGAVVRPALWIDLSARIF